MKRENNARRGPGGTARSDALLIGALLLLALAAWGAFRLWQLARARQLRQGTDGAAAAAVFEAVVTVDGQELARLPLDEDTLLLVDDEAGHSNTLSVSGGEVCVVQASCPDRICISQGRISQPGQLIVCLPNRLVVSVEAGASGSGGAPGEGGSDARTGR